MIIQINGHTDSRGTDAYNQELSERRARAVVDYLVQNGIDPGRATSRGFGSTRPVADNQTEAGRQLNRRVEFVVVKM
jgi:outer membrane protein OmpA-like peptidoglycan-associated protein